MTNFIFKKYPALYDKNFVKFFVSQFLFLSGGFIQNVALSSLILQNTDRKNALGIFLFASYLPVFLLSVPVAKLQGRISAKAVLLVSDGILFAMSLFIAIFSDLSFLGYVIFGSLWGVVRAFQTPFASSVPKLICDKENLNSGVGAVNLALCFSRGIGPVISGIVYTLFGYSTAFFVNAVSFVPSFILVLKTKIPKQKKTESKKSKPDIDIWLMITVFAVSFCGSSYNTAFSGIGKSLSLSPIWFSLFMGAVGVGAVAGAFLKSGTKRLVYSGFVIGALWFCMAFVKNGYIALFIAFLLGVCDYLFFTSVLCRINEQNDRGSIAKAMGIYTAVTTGALPTGYLAMSFFTNAFGIKAALIGCALVIATVYGALFSKIR